MSTNSILSFSWELEITLIFSFEAKFYRETGINHHLKTFFPLCHFTEAVSNAHYFNTVSFKLNPNNFEFTAYDRKHQPKKHSKDRQKNEQTLNLREQQK